MEDAIAEMGLFIDIGIGNFFGCDLGTGIGAGRFPVVKAGPGRTAFLNRAFFNDGDVQSLFSGGNGCKTTG